MGPIFKRLKAGNSDRTVIYVRFDLTDELGTAIAHEVGAGYGVEDIFLYSKSTGLIVIVDGATLARLDVVDLSLSEEQIKKRIALATTATVSR
jgi:hypothetical protein